MFVYTYVGVSVCVFVSVRVELVFSISVGGIGADGVRCSLIFSAGVCVISLSVVSGSGT